MNVRIKKESEKYTWQQFDEDIEKIAEWAKKQNFNSIYGIPTGGLTTAVKLHNILKIPLILLKDDITRDTLIVDDIVTTGRTINKLLLVLGSSFRVATLCRNEDAEKPDFFARQTNKWIVFPWETEETSEYNDTPIQ